MVDVIHLIFFYPQATTFSWYSEVLDEIWTLYLISMAILSLLAMGWYYFQTLPSPTAMTRFFVFITALVLIGTFFSTIYLYNSRDILFIESGTWEIKNTIIVAVCGLVSEIELLFITLIIYVALSLLPFMPGNLRAMRRYPLSWIP